MPFCSTSGLLQCCSVSVQSPQLWVNDCCFSAVVNLLQIAWESRTHGPEIPSISILLAGSLFCFLYCLPGAVISVCLLMWLYNFQVPFEAGTQRWISTLMTGGSPAWGGREAVASYYMFDCSLSFPNLEVTEWKYTCILIVFNLVSYYLKLFLILALLFSPSFIIVPLNLLLPWCILLCLLLVKWPFCGFRRTLLNSTAQRQYK